jgi:hypothetical protein
MMMIESSLLLACGEHEINLAAESLLSSELRQERECLFAMAAKHGIYPDRNADLLADFEDYCAAYSLPSTAPAMTAYLYELHHCCGASLAELREIAHAFLFENAWRVRVPILAVLRYCAGTPPSAIAAHAPMQLN